MKKSLFLFLLITIFISVNLYADETGSGNNINIAGQNITLETKAEGIVSTVNSTSVILSSGATFTGGISEILDYGSIFVNVFTDVASATDGLVIEQSADGVNFDHNDVYTVPAGGSKNYCINPHAKYLKVTYTNGISSQTAFRLQTIFKGNSTPSSHRIQDAIVDDDDARLTKAVVTGKDPNNVYRNVNATVDGDLKISDNSSGLAIAKGDVTGTSIVHKFGETPSFATGDNEVTIWDGANDADIDQMAYQYSTIADIDTISSSADSDLQKIEIQGLDINYVLVTQTITLQGQTTVALTTPLLRTFRMVNVSTYSAVGFIYTQVNGAVTAGVPDDPAKVRAIINNGNNQTLMAVYTIPVGKTGYMRSWYVSTSGASRVTNYIIKLKARPLDQVFQLKHKMSVSDTGTSSYQHNYKEPKVFAEKTDIEMTADVTASGISGASISAGFDIVLIDD